MKRTLFLLCCLAALTACETRDQSTLTGAATGAVIGAAVSGDDDKLLGALIGGAAGAAVGNYIGPARNYPGQCVYERADGTRFLAACP